jgi:hypothetical protein
LHRQPLAQPHRDTHAGGFDWRQPVHGAGSIRFFWTVGPRWEHFGPDFPSYITISVAGSQGAEALIYWTDLPSGLAQPCWWLRSRDAGPSGEHLATILAAAPGTDLVNGPSQVTLDQRPAQHLTLTVREDLGCDPGTSSGIPRDWRRPLARKLSRRHDSSQDRGGRW